MPATLTDPVLALSMANLQKLNTADVDQLANLWHVFTKCKESIESGRRLENLSWRLWFREAHLLPPDTSLSDLTDFTPLDTPLMSRRSSLSGSYQPGRALTALTPHQPSAPVTHRALQAAAIAAMASRSTTNATATAVSGALSDPEDGDEWSSDDETADDDANDAARTTDSPTARVMPKTARGRSHVRSPLTSPPATMSPKAATTAAAEERSTVESSTSSVKRRMASMSSSAGEARNEHNATAGAVTPLTASGDRRRAISSSSAFGSRARVKQHNMQRRRRPLSLQQAIESLLLGREDLSWSATANRRSAGLEAAAAAAAAASKSDDNLDTGAVSENGSGEAILQNSAPADFSQPATPQQSLATSQVTQQADERVLDREKADEGPKSKTVATAQAEAGKSSSKFFVGSTSFEGSDHSVESAVRDGSTTAKTTERGKKDVSTANPGAERRSTSQHMRKVPSDAGSNDSSKLRSARTAAHHAPHRHAQPVGHGAAQQLGHLPARTHAGARNKSAIGLIRPGAGARGRGHGRVASAVRIAPLTKDDGVKHDHDGHESPRAAAATTAKATSPLQPKKKRPPVTFTMGSLEDDSDDEDEDEDEDEDDAKGDNDKSGKAKLSEQQPKDLLASTSKVSGEKGVGGGAGAMDTSDEWSSDSSTDSEEERRRVNEERKRAERERLDSMFKKIPIRSKSAADVSLLGGESKKTTANDNVESRHIAEMSTSPGPTPVGPPIRSLLSTIFHPESEQELNLAIRRAHASAVDLHSQQHRPPQRSKTGGGRQDTNNSIPRPPSVSNFSGSFGGALKMSKSAVALPVLSTTGSRSTINTGRADDVRNSRNAAVFDDDDDEDEDDDKGDEHGGGDGAVQRLNELAHARQSQKQQKQSRRQGSNASESSDAQSRRRASADSKSKKRSSNASLDVQVTPDVDEEAIRQQRRTSAPSEMASTPAIAAPERPPYRSKSAVNVPDFGVPQSPRTTRRNMLRDELSESLRQNLLLERQSRHRMLGIGAQGPATTAAPLGGASGMERSDGQQHRSMTDPMAPPPPPPQLQTHNRQQSVLGGNALRPLTTRNSTASSSSSSQFNHTTNRGPTRYSGDFHQTGW